MRTVLLAESFQPIYREHIAMLDQPAVLFLLRAIHVVGGVLWVGGLMIVTFFLLPASRSLGPAAQPMLQDLMGRRKLPVYLMAVAIATTLAGILLMVRNVSLTDGAWARSPMGMGISIGAAAAIVALVVGMTVSAPAAKRLGGPPKPGGAPLTDEERARLMRRSSVGSRVVLVLLAISALTMATARYY